MVIDMSKRQREGSMQKIHYVLQNYLYFSLFVLVTWPMFRQPLFNMYYKSKNKILYPPSKLRETLQLMGCIRPVSKPGMGNLWLMGCVRHVSKPGVEKLTHGLFRHVSKPGVGNLWLMGCVRHVSKPGMGNLWLMGYIRCASKPGLGSLWLMAVSDQRLDTLCGDTTSEVGVHKLDRFPFRKMRKSQEQHSF